MVTVTAVYERDGHGRWLVHIAEEPRCHTWARSYPSARCAIMDATVLCLDELGVESLDYLDIRDEVRIAGATQARDLAEAREELTRRLTEVRARVGETARGPKVYRCVTWPICSASVPVGSPKSSAALRAAPDPHPETTVLPRASVVIQAAALRKR